MSNAYKNVRVLFEEKRFRLWKAYAIETDPTAKFKLGEQLKEAKNDLKILEEDFTAFPFTTRCCA